LTSWAVVIGDSDADAYDWEVREPNEDQLPRLKFAIRPERLSAHGFDDLLSASAIAGSGVSVQAAPISTLANTPPPLAPSVAAPPPLGIAPPVSHQYFLAVNGQQFGPYPAQQIAQFLQAGQVVAATTKVWRQGLAEWVDLNNFTELVGASQAPPPLPPAARPSLT
jgi:hypothetical protein